MPLEGMPPPPMVSPEQVQRMQAMLSAAQRMQELLGSAIVTQAQRSPNFEVPAPYVGHGDYAPQLDPAMIDHLIALYQKTGHYKPLPPPEPY
jgi:hypothetical protein